MIFSLNFPTMCCSVPSSLSLAKKLVVGLGACMDEEATEASSSSLLLRALPILRTQPHSSQVT